ncbi:MAG: choice-of-anchor D domain-containing protein [Algibacter sp.]
MNKITVSLRPYVLVFAFLFSCQLFSQIIIDSEDFESGWGIWNNGGSNSATRTSAQDSPTGSTSLRVRNGTGTSISTTDDIDLTGYTNIDFSFIFRTRNMESGEYFQIRYYDGSSWTTLATYTRGTDFSNSTTYPITLSLSSGSYTFSTNSRFEVQTYGNENNDRVYIDDILIEGWYCTSNGNDVSDEYISRVQLNSIDNTSGASASGYSDYTTISTTLNTNTNYTIDITPTWPGTNYDEGYAVWIDYNQDGDFDDTDENVFTLSPSQTTPASGNFTVPTTALSGNTRMRVSLKYNGIPDSCESFTWGEVEDYTVNINVSAFPEIDVTGQNNSIVGDGTNTPITTNDTDFGTTNLGTSISKTFTINNSGSGSLDLSSITLSNTIDFTLSGISTPTSLDPITGTTTFTVTFNALTTGTITPTVTIVNNDTNENSYIFNITAEALPLTSEMEVRGLTNLIIGDGTNTPITTDNTDFGGIYEDEGSATKTYTIHNTGGEDLTLGTLTLSNLVDFTLDTAGMLTTITPGNSTSFTITFDPTSLGTKTATLSIANNDTAPADYVFNIEGEGTPPTFTEVTVSVTWPTHSEYNKVEIYSPSDVLLATIDNGYYGVGNTSYTTSVNLSCLQDLNDYYYIIYDIDDNGWNGADNITITTIGGDLINTDDSDNANLAGYTSYFNVTGGTCGAEIDVKGNSTSIVGDGSNSPTVLDHTDFGNVQIVSEIITRTFTIYNLGGTDLTLGNISLSGSSDFTLDSTPTSGTVLGILDSADVQISFNTTSESLQTTTLTILSTGDTGEETYTINLSALGAKVFFDSDGDGVYDDVDIDDDNDGIKDSDEENACRLSNGSAQVDYKFLNETFGVGTTRGTGISSLYTAYTSYCIEDGITGSSCSGTDLGVGDGEYTISNMITTGVNGETVGPTDAIASWAWYAWAPVEDHTPGDTDGRMAIFNASYATGVFYETEIKGILSNVPINYSFWAINIDEPDQNFIDEEHGGIATNMEHRILPNITVNFLSADRSTVIASFDTGDITRCGDTFVDADHTGAYPHTADATYNMCETSIWQQFSQQFTTTETSFVVQFVNNAPGGAGNDLALDDIEIRQTLCDMDGDGVANVFDLDSDNDGIPDAVEANSTSAALSAGKGQLTGIAPWDDSLNNNGMHDSLEALSPIDTDSDTIPDYLDLDSDNDGIFDVDELGITNTNDTSFQNGDGDRTGNGTGDGGETETFREKDADGDGTIEGFGDGILDVYDFHEGNTDYSNSFGNDSQGTGPLYALDSDNDGIPDYKDAYNDITGIYDIDTVEIYAILPNTLGVLDDTTDADGDGIVASRDGDDTVFGSPRNLDNSYSLYFDGRNDYVEDTNIIPSGDATLMAFVKTDGTNTTGDNQIVAGQDDLYIIIDDATNLVSVNIEGATLTSTTALIDGIWTHIAVTTTSTSGGETILYINGVEENTVASGGITDASNFTIGRASTSNNYFKGEIEEVRVFSAALSSNEVSRMVYQELDDANSFNSGKIVQQNISETVGSNLVKYYKMDGFQDDILDDKKSASIDVAGAKVHNIKNIYFQRAPLPYETISDGDWTTTSNWLYGSEWDITSKQDNPNDASIVHIKHNIALNGAYDTQGTSALIIDNGVEFTIEADKGLYNSWYLELNGLIDLVGESQLVQTDGSYFEPSSTGTLERDQQGTSNTYLYNYWCSPVAPSSNSDYTLPNIFTNANFLTSGYNGTASPVALADYWIWKYTNRPGDTYSEWQHVRSTGTLKVGEGFTMKGSGASTPNQNYVLLGQPNNGDFSLEITAGNEYLVGNPYPSAMDANEFIKDNISNLETNGRNTIGNVINGALYFWDHFANNSHYLADYEGGYATYTLMGGARAISNDARINASNQVGTKLPERYIPVGQGFFVSAILDASLVSNDPSIVNPVIGGDILFKNSQRIFQKETVTATNSGSIFLKSNSKSKSTTTNNIDERQKIRLMFDSPDGYHRELLVGADHETTNGFDLGYEAVLIEENKEDMYWLLNNTKLIIQAVNNLDEEQVLPLGIKINKSGITTIKIDDLKNISTDKNIYVHDKELNTYHNLRVSNYDVLLSPGNYVNRFELTFKKDTTVSLSINDIEYNNIEVYYNNEKESIIIHNPTLLNIKSIEMYTILGQSIYKFNENSNVKDIEHKIRNLNMASYIIKLQTTQGLISKKILVK